MDDSVETKRKLEVLGDMPAIDMSMTEGEHNVGDLEGDDEDEEDANRIEEATKAQAPTAMEVDEDDDVDPLDAFMSVVKDEVKKVNAEDLKKMMTSMRVWWKTNWTRQSSTPKISWRLLRRKRGRRTWRPPTMPESITSLSERSFTFPHPTLLL
ncbi:hypothetical protein BV25DRAFT_66086 [Artomyces pyxidatus]|uniref:Uncharacterized protein n=1 Tax=Artomyces pyxidatus TaxID=48021 RepID=A0ACB8TKI1_9AGAM|nr:hypothetical protein BV25DRAFT_66086 [Artomyces pyxidatus]